MSKSTDSTNILVDYLIKRLTFEDQITINDFTEELPASIPTDLVEALYNQLLKQYEMKQLKMKSHIETQFNIPIKDLLSVASNNPETVKRPKLERLVKELEQLQARLARHELDLTSTIGLILRDIRKQIDLIRSLSDQSDAQIIEDALQKVHKVSSTLDMSL